MCKMREASFPSIVLSLAGTTHSWPMYLWKPALTWTSSITKACFDITLCISALLPISVYGGACVGNTPLHLAAAEGLHNMCVFLMENGADPTIENKEKQRPVDVATNDAIRTMLAEDS